jgi:sugar lactone lactonase YvrE
MKRTSRGWWAVCALSIAMVAAALAWAMVLERIDAPGPQPEGLASDGTHLWVADFQSGLIYRVDTGAKTVIAAYEAPGPSPEGLAWDGTHLWHCDWDTRMIYRLSVSDSALTVDREFPAPLLLTPGGQLNQPRPIGLAWDGAALWLTTWRPFYLVRIDPVSGAVLRSRPFNDPFPLYPTLGPAPEDLAWDGSHLWITDWWTKEIHRLDPASLVVTRTIASGGPKSVGLAFHLGDLWNGDTGMNAVAPALYRLDPSDQSPVLRTTWGRLKRLGLQDGEP